MNHRAYSAAWHYESEREVKAEVLKGIYALLQIYLPANFCVGRDNGVA